MKILHTIILVFLTSISVFSQSREDVPKEEKTNSLKPVKSNIQQLNDNVNVKDFVEKWVLFSVKSENTDSKYKLDGNSYIDYYRNSVYFKLNSNSPLQKGKFYQTNNTIKIISDSTDKCSNCVSELLITRNSENDTEFNLLIDNKISHTITTTIIK
jgi:hypothetical protein